MSTPTPPTQQPVEQPISKPAEQSTSGAVLGGLSAYAKSASGIAIIVASILLILLPSIGAAKLSHDKFGSIGWAILAFIFSPIYYVYYAYFVSTRQPMIQQPLLGGRRRR